MGFSDAMNKKSIISLFYGAKVTLPLLLFGDAGQPRMGIHATGQLYGSRSGLPESSDDRS